MTTPTPMQGLRILANHLCECVATSISSMVPGKALEPVAAELATRALLNLEQARLYRTVADYMEQFGPQLATLKPVLSALLVEKVRFNPDTLVELPDAISAWLRADSVEQAKPAALALGGTLTKQLYLEQARRGPDREYVVTSCLPDGKQAWRCIGKDKEEHDAYLRITFNYGALTVYAGPNVKDYEDTAVCVWHHDKVAGSWHERTRSQELTFDEVRTALRNKVRFSLTDEDLDILGVPKHLRKPIYS